MRPKQAWRRVNRGWWLLGRALVSGDARPNIGRGKESVGHSAGVWGDTAPRAPGVALGGPKAVFAVSGLGGGT